MIEESLACNDYTCKGHPAASDLHIVMQSVLAISVHTLEILVLHWLLSDISSLVRGETGNYIRRSWGMNKNSFAVFFSTRVLFSIRCFHKPQGLIINIYVPAVITSSSHMAMHCDCCSLAQHHHSHRIWFITLAVWLSTGHSWGNLV